MLSIKLYFTRHKFDLSNTFLRNFKEENGENMRTMLLLEIKPWLSGQFYLDTIWRAYFKLREEPF
jgi:hypothetical protein